LPALSGVGGRALERAERVASMAGRVYLETTIPSYLTAWLSRDLVMAGRQLTTREWWEKRRLEFEIFVSQVVLDEAARGDPDAAKRRLEVLVDLPLLEVSGNARSLAQELMERVTLPSKAAADALHIAIAAVNGMDYLVTWNCSHIANAELRRMIDLVCRDSGFEPPIICTPEELLKG
jgi:predicted nucleic acid-binding protein